MGWSIYLVEPVTREVIVLPFKHQMFGSTYCVGGTDELWIDITYNYDKIYREKIMAYHWNIYMINSLMKLLSFSKI